MVSRFAAFTIAVLWIAVGLAVGIVALSLAAQGTGDDGLIAAVTGAFRDGLTWWLLLTPACVVIAGLWIGLGPASANSSAGLGAQGALIGLAAAMTVLLLLLILSQAFGLTLVR